MPELSFDQLRHFCDVNNFKFSSTEELQALSGIVGQDRALHAVSFCIDMKSPRGYNLYALGPYGTGKTTTISKFLEEDAAKRPKPDDWFYINNFNDRDKPRTLRLPSGRGLGFRDDIDQLVEELKNEVPKAFEGEEYEKEQESIEQQFQRRTKELLRALDEKAQKMGFKFIQTPQGMAPYPIVEKGLLKSNKEIPEKKMREIETKQEELLAEMREIMRQIEQLQKEGREQMSLLDRRVIGFLVNHLINDLKDKYKDLQVVNKYLDEVQEHLLKNIPAFKQFKQMESLPAQQKAMMGMSAGGAEFSFDEYRVNLIVDNSQTKGAPVILEKNPTGPNIIGRIEQQGWFGALITNFRMIKAGSLHHANGGYLIIEALDLLTKPFSWQVLKRALKNQEIAIESMADIFGGIMTRTLEPEPIPLDIKIILIGDPYIYYTLYELDPEFKELFKIKADFEVHMPWNDETLNQYAQFIGTICREEMLKHFAPSGVAKVIEFGARMVDHQKKLATKFGDVVDLIRQANYWSNKSNHNLVQAEDVQQALEEKIYRSNRIEKQIQEMIEEGTILIDIEGKVIGQVNGLSVLSMGDYSFGKPSRVTARTFVGGAGVVNIDREVELGGPIHNKGSMIMIGYLGGKYANDVPLSFSSSITFEQVYEEVEGDSASSTEMYALLSSLSRLPLRQDLAVTGSVNQRGEIQPIGGANEKIESFFQICKLKGLSGTQGVVIPKQNINHLMLREEVVQAVKDGKFHIFAVGTIDEGMEILTGLPAGELSHETNAFPANTINDLVQKRIIELAKTAKEFSAADEKETKE